MAESDPIYDPERKAPAPAPKQKAATEPKAARTAGKDKTSDTAIDVTRGVTADASLAPVAGAPADDRKALASEIERIRKMRAAFGGQTQKLAVRKRTGYHQHWFNDVAGRISEAQESGWAHIEGRDGKPLRRAVGTGRDNGVLYAFAMELPEVFWQEDMAARHAQAKARIDAIKEAPARAKPGQAKKSDAGKFYNPVEESGAPPVDVHTK